MENSTYILVPSAGGHQLQIPVAASSASAAVAFTRANSDYAAVGTGVNNAHGANPSATGKSVLNVRTVGPNIAGSWKSSEAANRPMNTQTHPVRFIVANSKDGFVNVPNFASLTSGTGATQGVATGANTAAANNSRVALVKHSGAGVPPKIVPVSAAVNFSTPVPNGSLRATIPGGNKVLGRTAVPVASFSNNASAIVPKTTSSAGGAAWGSLSVANSTLAAGSATVTSPSKQLIIQLSPEQLVCLCFLISCQCFDTVEVEVCRTVLQSWSIDDHIRLVTWASLKGARGKKCESRLCG